jgi:aspartokinase
MLTEAVHGNARISEINPVRVMEALADNKVVIVAGFKA